MRYSALPLIIVFAVSLAYCGLGMTFVSERNLRAETINYDGFRVSVSAGGNAGARKAIVLRVMPRREVAVQADAMQVYFRGKRIGYDILDEGKPTDQRVFTVFRDEKAIIYRLEVDGIFSKRDSLLFFAPQIFQVGEQFYDLDTLVFKLPM